MEIIKRNGSKENFDGEKIVNAVQKAFEDVDGELTEFAINKAK